MNNDFIAPLLVSGYIKTMHISARGVRIPALESKRDEIKDALKFLKKNGYAESIDVDLDSIDIGEITVLDSQLTKKGLSVFEDQQPDLLSKLDLDNIVINVIKASRGSRVVLNQPIRIQKTSTQIVQEFERQLSLAIEESAEEPETKKALKEKVSEFFKHPLLNTVVGKALEVVTKFATS